MQLSGKKHVHFARELCALEADSQAELCHAPPPLQEDNEALLAYFFLWKGCTQPPLQDANQLDKEVETYLNGLINKTRQTKALMRSAGHKDSATDADMVVKSSGYSSGGAPGGGRGSSGGAPATIKRSSSIMARKAPDIPEVTIDFEVRLELW